MTTLKRALIILLAALAIAGGLYGLVQTGWLGAVGAGREQEFRGGLAEGGQAAPDGQRPEFRSLPEGAAPPGFEGGRGRGGFAGGEFGHDHDLEGGRGLGTLLKNGLIIGGIVAAVAFGAWALNRFRRRRPTGTPPAAA